MLKKITRCDALRALQIEMSETLDQYNTDNATNIQCYYDNVVERPENGLSTFIRFTINFAGSSEKLSPDTYRQAGIAVAQVCTPLGKGLNESASITEHIESAFTNLVWEGNSLEIVRTALSTVGTSGSHYVENVNIYFQYNKGK
jgi:hypothetical protein